MSSKIGKSTGCHSATAASPDGTVGASVFIIETCGASAGAKSSERAARFANGDGSTGTQRVQRSAATRNVTERHLRETSGESKASVTTNGRADGGRLRHHCSLCGGLVQQGRDDNRRLVCVIDAIDVVAILVPEEDAWQFEAAETCIPETQLLDREQETIEVVDHEDPSTSEAIDAYDAITGERLDIQKRCGRDEPKRCENKMKLNSKWRSTNQRCERRRASTSGHGGWTHEKGPASSAVRCRLCATKSQHR